MSDAPIPAPLVPTIAPVRSGVKTTEMWLALFAMGGLTYAMEEVLKVLPTIAANPALPPWASPLLALAPIGIGYLMKVTAKNYCDLRRDLKLGEMNASAGAFDMKTAVAAGVAQAKQDDAAQLEQANR